MMVITYLHAHYRNHSADRDNLDQKL
jgi:hypothetical protein